MLKDDNDKVKIQIQILFLFVHCIHYSKICYYVLMKNL